MTRNSHHRHRRRRPQGSAPVARRARTGAGSAAGRDGDRGGRSRYRRRRHGRRPRARCRRCHRPSRSERRRLVAAARKLDRRTIAICACIAPRRGPGHGARRLGRAGRRRAPTPTSDAPAGHERQHRAAARPAASTPSTAAPPTSAAYADDQPMLVNLWASNCVPCIDEMPLLEQARADNPDVTFVGVATQDRARPRRRRWRSRPGSPTRACSTPPARSSTRPTAPRCPPPCC